MFDDDEDGTDEGGFAIWLAVLAVIFYSGLIGGLMLYGFTFGGAVVITILVVVGCAALTLFLYGIALALGMLT